MAKSFKNLISEVAQPKAAEERAFKNQHTIDKRDAQPSGQEHIFKGTIQQTSTTSLEIMATARPVQPCCNLVSRKIKSSELSPLPQVI